MNQSSSMHGGCSVMVGKNYKFSQVMALCYIATNLLCCFGPKNGNQIMSCNWWREISTDSLNVDEKLATLYILHNWNPQDTYSSHYGDHNPAQ